AVAVDGIEPPAVRHDAIWSGEIVVHRTICVEHDADETGEPPLERVVLGIDDVDARVRAIGQVVLGAIGIDEADVERPERVVRDLNRGQASGLSGGRCPWAGAWWTGERGSGAERQSEHDHEEAQPTARAHARW